MGHFEPVTPLFTLRSELEPSLANRRPNLHPPSDWTAMNRRTIRNTFAGALIAGLAVGLTVPVLVGSSDPELPPCPTEDSDNCTWDAAVQGNGEGRSFVVRGGTVTYTDELPEGHKDATPVEPEVAPAPVTEPEPAPVVQPEVVQPEVVQPAPVQDTVPEAEPEVVTPAPVVAEPEPPTDYPHDVTPDQADPTTPHPDEVIPTDAEWFAGHSIGDIIVCPTGTEVSIDYSPQGTLWAGCM